MQDLPAIDRLSTLVRAYGRERRDDPAIEFRGEQITWGELDRGSSRVANALAAAGCGAESRVAALMKNCPEFYELLFGAAKIGAVAVAINWRLAAREIADVISDAGAELLVVGSEYALMIDEIRTLVPGVARVVVIDEGPSGFRAWADQHADVDPGYEAAVDDTALHFYTSGTTGVPKGVLLSHRAYFTRLQDLGASWGFTDTSRVMCAMPNFHVGGTGWALGIMRAGATVVLLEEVDPNEILKQLPGCTHVFLVPAVISILLGEPEIDTLDFNALETIVYGGSPISPTLLRRAMSVFGCEFIQSYGLTEACGAVLQLGAESHDPDGLPELLTSCGKPHPWVEMRLVEHDPSGLGGVVDVNPGEVGEVWVRTVQIMNGYWRRPTETAEAVTPDGWLRTGDAGYQDADGFLYLHDRVKDMIVTGGENVYPIEVENVLAEHPSVAQVAVVGVPHEKWGETVKAVVVPVGSESPDPAELISFCSARLARFKCPTSVDFTDDLPRTASGKLLKRQIREPYWETASRRVG